MSWTGEDWAVIGFLVLAGLSIGVFIAAALFASGDRPDRDDDWPTGIGA